MGNYLCLMETKHYSAKIELKDAEGETKRRFRNILANSGEIMESGEIRALDDLYVMGYDGELYKISDLNTNPDKQTEKYAVKAQADHGEMIGGELTPTIEKQFGSCKVWLENDGLHARMYFADNDALADHAYAISRDASYSTGIDWFPDGYYGTGYEIEQPIGILREISMVLTGNDPRAKTIDTKQTESKGIEGAAEVTDGVNNNLKKGNLMTKKLDELTPDERDAMGRRIAEIIDDFTTDAPESETEPTRRDTKDAEGEEAEAPAETPETKEEVKTEEAPKEESKDSANIKHNTVLVIKDNVAKQEKGKTMTKSTDWLYGAEGKRAFADTLKAAGGRLNATFDSMWRAELAKHTNDDITGLALPVDVQKRFISALGNSDGIISHFAMVNTKGLNLNLLDAASDEGGRAKGHKKGDTKADQSLTNTIRSVYTKMVYKRLALDAMDLYENPELIEFRADELVANIIKEIERAAVIGDGRQAPSGTDPDYRMFDSTTSRGFFSIAADAAAQSGFGTSVASAVSGANNLYEGVIKGRSKIKTEGAQFIVAKSSAVEDLLLKSTANGYFVQPGQRVEDVLQVSRVYTPSWMENATADAYLIVDNAYKMIGESNIRVRSDFDTSTNQDILLDETPRGGSLGEYKSAVAISLTAESE